MESAATTENPPVTEKKYEWLYRDSDGWNGDEVICEYLRKIKEEGGGYDVTRCSGTPFIPVELSTADERLRNDVMKATEFAIRHINAETKTTTGKTYKLLLVKKVVYTTTFSFLLTFTAAEFSAGDGAGGANDTTTPERTLQATVYLPCFKDPELEEWRFKPGA